MGFGVECKAPVDSPSESAIRRGIKSLRSYGPSSFASLADAEGNYVQVGGGGVTCQADVAKRDPKQRELVIFQLGTARL